MSSNIVMCQRLTFWWGQLSDNVGLLTSSTFWWDRFFHEFGLLMRLTFWWGQPYDEVGFLMSSTSWWGWLSDEVRLYDELDLLMRSASWRSQWCSQSRLTSVFLLTWELLNTSPRILAKVIWPHNICSQLLSLKRSLRMKEVVHGKSSQLIQAGEFILFGSQILSRVF